MGQIVCQTSRLSLRKLEAGDVDSVVGIMCDPEVMRFSIFGPESREGVIGYLTATQKRYQRDGIGQWAVVGKENNDFIGLCGICTQLVDGRVEYELGYRLARRFWGNGFATEAATACRDYAFKSKELKRLISIIEAPNLASVRVAKKIGMRLEKDAIFYGSPVKIFSLALSDFAESRP